MTNISDAEKLFRSEVASDIRLIAMLHDREPQAALIEDLRKVPVENWFGMKLTSDISQRGTEVMNAALKALPRQVGDDDCDQLAVDFANIYLVHTYRATPTESPWLDKDGLERQGPMFSVAQWYRRHGLAAQDRQKRSDDHLVLQLQFLSHLFEKEDGIESLKEAARFMDAHILKWIGAFAERVAGRCQTPYYAAIVTLTHGYLQDLREQLVKLADEPRPEPVDDDEPTVSNLEPEAEAQRYVPGISPSW